jgi:membrane protein DedA with SNARE-associated domain
VEFIESHLDFLIRHILTVVFVGFLVEAAGVPFPSRLLLIVAATVADQPRQLVALVAVGTVGSLIGDHVPYLAGALTGPRILAFYCRLTLGSAACVDKTVGYFRRFGAAAILMSRFSAGVRLFASALSGCGHISYRTFITFDVIGTVLYLTLWSVVGYLIGDQAAEFLSQHGRARLLVLVGPLAFATLLAYRLWQRRRDRPADASAIVTGSACVEELLEQRRNV